MSWGPLIHGHAPKGLVKALSRGGRARHELRRADRARDPARPARLDADAVDGAHPLRQLRDRSHDERGASRAGVHEAGQDRQVRRLLSRPCRRIPGEGRFGRDDARRADEPGRAGSAPRATRCSRATTISTRSSGCSSRTAARLPRSSSNRSPATWASCRRVTDSCEGLRNICDREGSLLIFDEVISGFRAAAGGAQQLFGVKPDLTCLGKIIGGGLPVGAYGGRADVMELMAPSGPVYQAGTLSGNPLAMTAGLWCLERAVGQLYRHLAKLGARLAAGLADAAREAGVPMQVNGFGSAADAVLHLAAGPRLRVGGSRGYGAPTAGSSAGCSRAGSIRRRRNSRRGSSRARTPSATSTGRVKAARERSLTGQGVQRVQT